MLRSMRRCHVLLLRILCIPVVGAPWVIMLALGCRGIAVHGESMLAWLLGGAFALAGLAGVVRTARSLLGAGEVALRRMLAVQGLLALAAKILLLLSGVWIAISGQGRCDYVLVGGLVSLAAVLLLLWSRVVAAVKRIRMAADSRRRDEGAPPVHQVAVLSAEGVIFSKLYSHFRKLSEHDDLALAEEDFLSWNSEQFAAIRICRCGAEDWAAVFWGRTNRCLSALTLGRFCSAQGIALPDHFANVEPDGIAFCREGKLVIYPESEAQAFMSDFGRSLLCSDAVFDAWLEEYTS